MDAIIIVDLQKAFPIPRELVERIEARSRDFPRRVFTRFFNVPESLFRRKLKRSSCQPGTAETELLLPVRPGDLVIEKTGYSLAPPQVQQIANAGIRRALVCGADTDACVLGVVFTLFDAGIDCEVEPELCWSSTGLHEPAVRIIREQFGTAK
jgi:nicotinamidase-related amidase